MKQLLFVLLALIFSVNTFGQPFEKTFSPGYATSVVQREDSSFVLSIYQLNHGLFEIGPAGDSILYTNYSYCAVEKIIKSRRGGFLATGTYIHPASSSDACILRLDSSLDTLWVKEYPSIGFFSRGEEIIELPDSTLLLSIAGNAGMSHVGFRLLHLDRDGNILWEKNPLPESNAYIYNLACNDSFVFTALNSDQDCLQLNCYDIHTGDTIWEKKYFSFTVNSVITLHNTNSMILSDSALYIAGSDLLNSSGIPSSKKMILKTDLLGDSVWLQTYGQGSLTRIILDSNNNFCCTANETDSISLLNFDIGGSLIWTKKFLQFNKCYVNDLISTYDGGFAFCGQAIDTINNIYYTYVIRTDSTGDGFFTSTFPAQTEMPIRIYYESGPRQLMINCNSSEDNSLSGSIYSLNGSLLSERSLSRGINIIAFGDAAPGTYVVVIRKNNNIVSRNKIIVN